MSQHNVPVVGTNGQLLMESNSDARPNSLMERDSNGDSKGRILEGTTGLKSGGYLQAGVAVKAANFTLDDTAHTYIVNTGAADVTVTVPSFSTIPGRPYVLIKGDNGIGKIVLDAFGAELINGAGLFNGTATQLKRIEFVNDGAAGYAKEL